MYYISALDLGVSQEVAATVADPAEPIEDEN
jgi:hypothetical protein